MSTKLALFAAFAALLAPLLTGCMCTRFVSSQIGCPSYDKFKPVAVYRLDTPVKRTENATRFALEGTRDKRGKTHTAYMFIPEDLLVRANAQTNQTLSLADIQKAYAQLAFPGDETRRKLPSDYVRVANLPEHNFALNVGAYQTGAAWGYAMPFALILDVVTFPVQVVYVAAGGDPRTNR